MRAWQSNFARTHAQARVRAPLRKNKTALTSSAGERRRTEGELSEIGALVCKKTDGRPCECNSEC